MQWSGSRTPCSCTAGKPPTRATPTNWGVLNLNFPEEGKTVEDTFLELVNINIGVASQSECPRCEREKRPNPDFTKTDSIACVHT